MFDDDAHPMPDPDTLREMIRKARALESFNEKENYYLVNILVTLQRDPMYKLRERMRRYEREAKDGKD